MIKKTHIKLVLAIILLLTVFSALGSIVQATATDKYTVSIEYNPNACTVTVTVDGAVQNPTEVNGQTYLIDKNHRSFKVEITPKTGYRLSPLTDKATDQAFAATDGLFFEPPIDKDMDFKVVETPMVYTVKEQGAAGQNHTLVFTEKTYTYSSTDSVTLPIPTLNGYKFIGWQISDDSGSSFTLGTIENNAIVFSTSYYPKSGDTFYAKPIWEGEPQNVTRYDCEYDPTGNTKTPVNDGVPGISNTTSWTEPTGEENVNGKDGGNAVDASAAGIALDRDGYKKYVGYYDFADYCAEQYFERLGKVKTDVSANVVYRYYVPIEYTVKYEGVEDSTGYPTAHVYNVATPFADCKPERVGYNFAGWRVYVQKNGVMTDVTASLNNNGGIAVYPNLTLNAREIALAEGNENSEIVLEAVWTPKTFAVTYDWNGADESALTFTKLTEYVYDTDLVITDPIRVGYTFRGWEVTSGEITGKLESVEGKTTLAATAYVADITLKALWTANEYTVTFDENLAEQKGTESMKVTFDALPDLSALQLPVREGHMFLGFTLTKDGDDAVIDANGQFLRAAWDIAADTALYAKWGVISYEVTVNVSHAQVWINGELYSGTAFSIPYGTTVTVKALCESGYKVTKWEGESVSHQKEFETTFTMGAGDLTLDLAVLPVVTSPSFSVDYVKELFLLDAAQDGLYRITCGEQALELRVSGADLYVNGTQVTQIAIPNAFFGETVRMSMYGNGTTTADSDPTELMLAARPEKPVLNDHISGTTSETYSVAVNLNLNSGYTYEYEFALSLNADGSAMLIDWTSPDGVRIVRNDDGSVDFKDLHPGTDYYIFVRVKAVAGQAPHGEEQYFKQNTAYEDYFNQILADLESRKDGGAMVEALINAAKDEIKALKKPSATFYDSLMGIYNRTLLALPFAQEQDAKIAELKALHDTLIATEEFNLIGQAELGRIYQAAVAEIQDAEAQDEIQGIYLQAVAEMQAVKISYLFTAELRLTSLKGLLQGSKLILSRITDISALTDAVDAAIRAGKVSVGVGTDMTLAEAADKLSTLELMAAYKLKITHNNLTMTFLDDSFELRLLLPEELRGVSGLQVACYDETTGVLEILSTKRDGNYLVFETLQPRDFVLLGDPTMNLTGFIVALGVTLLCQLIAIVWLTVRRAKNAKSVRRYSLALPAVLAIQFLPENAILIVTVLGGLVVLCQIILTYLLLSSDVIRRRKQRTRPVERAPEESLPVMAEPEDKDVFTAEDASEETAAAEGGDEAFAYEYAAADAIFDGLSDSTDTADGDAGSEDAFDEVGFEEAPLEEDAEDELMDVDGDAEDFIEPAANPRYSLPEEELADTNAWEDAPAEEGDPLIWEPVPEESEAEESDADEPFETEEALVEEEPLSDSTAWEFDDAPADTVLEEDLQDVSAEPEEEAPEAFSEEPDESAEAPAEKEADAEATEEVEEDNEPEFYIEPDAEGDRAPAPGYSDL
ncbi:MAG: InlB B-repeat-containing protein [Clostridia bacterium]|nr:InlB B-repeat-containing protein [Clostridia bacterium]